MIMKAAGKDIKPYWDQYTVHHDPKIEKMLDKYFIGYLDKKDIDKLEIENKKVEEEFIDTEKLNIKTDFPLNIETKLDILRENYLTPNNIWYIRNHHKNPDIDINNYSLHVTNSNISKKYSINDLKKFSKKEIIVTIQCAGNRRNEFNFINKVLGLTWDGGAISTAKFGGVLLRDVLEDMNININNFDGDEFVQLYGIDNPYDSSISLNKVLEQNGDVILAYEMNGEDLPKEHGYPIRIIVPGYSGAKNVKWLHEIKISKEESKSTWQKGIAYKGLPNYIKSLDDIKNINIDKIPTIETLPVQSIICYPKNNDIIE